MYMQESSFCILPIYCPNQSDNDALTVRLFCDVRRPYTKVKLPMDLIRIYGYNFRLERDVSCMPTVSLPALAKPRVMKCDWNFCEWNSEVRPFKPSFWAGLFCGAVHLWIVFKQNFWKFINAVLSFALWEVEVVKWRTQKSVNQRHTRNITKKWQILSLLIPLYTLIKCPLNIASCKLMRMFSFSKSV